MIISFQNIERKFDMAGETKSNGQKDFLDRFYTPLPIVKQCLNLVNFSQFDCIIEPSAGTGNFLSQFPNEIDKFGYDLFPEGNNIEQADWFNLNKEIFNNYKSILVCGNPPFGQQNKLAINFFNESAKFCNTIAFILPLSFKKDSIQNRLDLHFSLVKELLLPDCKFLLLNQQEVLVPCVFQIWERQENLREKVKLPLISNLFDFVDKNNADFRIQRVGGNAGKASFDLSKSASSNYFIKNKSKLSNEDFVKLVNSLEFPTITFATGPKSLSKGELISIIEENI